MCGDLLQKPQEANTDPNFSASTRRKKAHVGAILREQVKMAEASNQAAAKHPWQPSLRYKCLRMDVPSRLVPTSTSPDALRALKLLSFSLTSWSLQVIGPGGAEFET